MLVAQEVWSGSCRSHRMNVSILVNGPSLKIGRAFVYVQLDFVKHALFVATVDDE